MPADYKKGTIKIKTADEQLVPFMPSTDISNVRNVSTGTTLSQKIANLNSRIAGAAGKGGIKVMYEEPTAANTTSFGAKTLIGYVVPENVVTETWSFTIDTQNNRQDIGDTKGAIPINLYYSSNSNTSIEVDWGDNTKQTLTKSDYPTCHDSYASVHTYKTKGIYTIKLTSANWNDIYICTSYGEYRDGVQGPGSSEHSDSATIFISTFHHTVTSINNSLPLVKGTMGYDTQHSSWNRRDGIDYIFCNCDFLTSIPNNLFQNINSSSFRYCFYNCESLQEIPEHLFDKFIDAFTFSFCFCGCTSITSIPANLFKYNTNVQAFDNCFRSCESLASIPADLFKYNIKTTTFDRCFNNCSSLTSIPDHLFDSCTAVTTFADCFRYYIYGSSIGQMKIQSIPNNLFKYNTAATDFSMCFASNSALTSIPEDLFRYNDSAINFSGCFANNSALTSIPENLFKYNTSAETFSSVFRTCSALVSIPENLFKYNTNANTFLYCFENCDALNDFVIHIGSSSVISLRYCERFCNFKTGTTRIVYVPDGSTTQTAFNDVASSLGITVIGE